MVILIVLTLYPFIYIIFASISNPSLFAAHTGLLLKPLGVQFGAYTMVFRNKMVLVGYKNTLIYVTLGTTINIIMTTLSAYVLSRKGYIWKNLLIFYVVITMFFSGGLIPFYLTVKSLGLGDNILALILPNAINTYNLIIMRTSFGEIPDSLEESAKIDGANDFTVLFRIFVPLSLPIIAVMILFYGVVHWNSWFYAMIFLRSRKLFPLQIILREILIANNTEYMASGVSSGDMQAVGETVKYATIIVSTLPIVTIYPFLQKYFVKGIMIGAIKG
ncbi:MAG: carbohydrate ABC transporter permease [Clostridiales bacterium]|nr:carbohydrate ABC transporter permease [Clostridiales bacterium]